MLHRKKILIPIIIVVISSAAYTQSYTNSPYSMFGVGDIVQKGFGQNRAMGGIAYGLRTKNHINFLNPASYTAIDTLSFVFDFGFQGSMVNYTTEQFNQVNEHANIDHLSFAFPITRWLKSSAGILPYSSVGYQMKDGDLVPGNNIEVDYFYSGSGGLSQVYIGNAVQLMKKFSLGFNASYIFGSIDKLSVVSYPDNSTFARTETDNNTIVGGFMFDYGLQFTDSLGKNMTYTLGVNFNNDSRIKSYYTRFSESILSFGGLEARHTLIDIEGERSNIVIPQSIGIGFSTNVSNKFLFGADYTTQAWSRATFLGESDSLTNSSSINAGFEYVANPDFRTASSYWQVIRLRAGGYYSNTNLELRGQQITDYGVSFGLGLPFRNVNSMFNLAVELGERGTVSNGLINERYAILSISFTLHDFWFIKRRFD